MGTNLHRTAALVLALIAVGCSSGDGSETTGTTAGTGAAAATGGGTTEAARGPAQRVPVSGFGEVAFSVQSMPNAQRCALLAETSSQHAQGLMNRRDLSGYDGMLFDFGESTTSTFWMKDTPLPLSIAWFDASGRFVSSADMEPCIDRPSCPSYSAAAAYRYALEVPQGALRGLGIGPGSVITVGGACPS